MIVPMQGYGSLCFGHFCYGGGEKKEPTSKKHIDIDQASSFKRDPEVVVIDEFW